MFRDDCKASVEGYPDNKYKGFNSQADATSYVAGYTLANKQQKEAAQKAVAERFSIETMARQMAEVCREVMGSLST